MEELIDFCAETIINQKKIKLDLEKNRNTFNKIGIEYLKTHNKMYGAVLIHIHDNVIAGLEYSIDNNKTKEGKLNQELISGFSSLVRKRVAIGFITGKGRTSSKSILYRLARQIMDSDQHITWDYFSRWYCITHSGQFILYTSGKNHEEFLDNEYCLLSDKEQLLLPKINDLIIRQLHVHGIAETNISKEPYSIRVKTVDLGKKLILKIFDVICTELKKTNNDLDKMGIINKLKLIHGTYNKDAVSEITITDKNYATKILNEKFIGIFNDNILRIADYSKSKGNEAVFLNSPNAFSLNNCNKKYYSCYPVVDIYNNEVLKGKEALLYLLNNVKFYTHICKNNKKIFKEYKTELANLIKKARIGSEKITSFYVNRISWLDFLYDDYYYDEKYRLEKIFNQATGSVFFTDEEWEILNYKYKSWQQMSDLIEAKIENVNYPQKKPDLKYFMHSDNGVLFRGINIYYKYLHSDKICNEVKSSALAELYETNAKTFFKISNNLFRCIINNNIIIDSLLRKVLIGCLDNYRNILLLQINYEIQKLNVNETEKYDEIFRIEIEGYIQRHSSLTNKILYLQEVLESMYTLLFETNPDIKTILEKHTKKNYNDFSEKYCSDSDVLHSSLRNWRECDNFVENVAAVEIFLRDYQIKISNDPKINFWGISYGGIELPIIASVLCKKHNINNTINYVRFKPEEGKYPDRHTRSRQIECREKLEYISNIDEIRNGYNVLMDDNVTTGRTLELGIQICSYYNFTIDSIILVKYLGLNRLEHIFGNIHEDGFLEVGTMDLSLFFKMIKGLVSQSNYSKLFQYALCKQYPYEDELNRFDITKQFVMDLIRKNYYPIQDTYKCEKCTYRHRKACLKYGSRANEQN